jgi:CRISPR-associated protein Cmr2
MSETPMIHFTIGPVQDFVAQARRTRDLWSGSFLLSYLTGCAIKCIQDQHGEIEIPDISTDRLLDWIKKPRDEKDNPMIGSLPNRFEASAPDPVGVAEDAARAVRCAWIKIGNAVYNRYAKDIVNYGIGTQGIWDRQVKSFWEISWTVDSNIDSINYRKNWRSHMPPVEGGDHCTIMGDWQEISGFIRSKNRETKEKQDLFWRKLREGTGGMDLREGERLCSISLIKRMFPKVSKEAIGWNIRAENWPSTAYMAAIPWLKQAAKKAPNLCEDYARYAMNAASDVSREGISEKAGICSNALTASFLNLDGNFYFTNAIENCDRTPLKGTPRDGDCRNESQETQLVREGLKAKLSILADKDNAGSSPSSFYGLLIMDGDNMGSLIREKGASVSGALGKFTDSVHKTVKDYNGITIYAGGDDVLAMLPAESAIGCSLALSDCYRRSFKSISDPRSTISAGVVFSHYRFPLRAVLHEAHNLLDDVAKEQNGRGSLAVSVLKPSGKHCQWTSTWDYIMVSEGRSLFDDLLPALRVDRQFSTRFFYSIREIFNALTEDLSEKPGSYVHLTEGMDPVGLLAAEYMMSREWNVTREYAETQMERLLKICCKSRRDKNGKEMLPDERCLSTDGLMLLKFLSQVGEEVY